MHNSLFLEFRFTILIRTTEFIQLFSALMFLSYGVSDSNIDSLNLKPQNPKTPKPINPEALYPTSRKSRGIRSLGAQVRLGTGAELQAPFAIGDFFGFNITRGIWGLGA